MSPSNSSTSSSSNGTSTNNKGQAKYKGLFSHQMAPTSRAYLILFSFFGGVLLITTGSVFYHVITMHPMSGMHPMHTPPLALACFLIAAGVLTVLASFGIAWRYGFDDGDDSLDDDLAPFSKEDVLDEQYQSISKEGPPV